MLLAGDAAHQMPPFAGQGMCSGLRDAANLAWKLDLVLAGVAPPTLLDAYELERTDNVRAVIDFSMALGKVICITDPDEAAARDAMMVDTAATVGIQTPPPLPGITNGIVRSGDPLAGRLFVQGRVDTGEGILLLDDVVGAGWRLVTIDPDLTPTLPTDVVDWFVGIGGALVTITEGDDVDGTYAEWFRSHDVATVLQRPDFSVFGAVSAAEHVAGLVEALRAGLDELSALAAPIPRGGTP